MPDPQRRVALCAGTLAVTAWAFAAWLIYDERLAALELAGAVVVLVALAAIIHDVRTVVPEVEAAVPVTSEY